MNEWEALNVAVQAARRSGCQKSRRGVVLWRRGGGVLSVGFNTPPPGFSCDGSAQCRRDCGKICIHAENYAILVAGRMCTDIVDAEMLHVKVVDGKAVTSACPSCWQCSRELLMAGISYMWLYEVDPSGGPNPILRRYSAAEFHEATLRNCGLHPFSAEAECSLSEHAEKSDTARTQSGNS